MSDTINAFEMAQAQFDDVATKLNLDPYVAQFLRQPMREYKFTSAGTRSTARNGGSSCTHLAPISLIYAEMSSLVANVLLSRPNSP